MVNHKSYSKLLQHYDTKKISDTIGRNSDLNSCEYIVTEKVHGSNLCFIVNTVNGNTEVRVASRNQFCSDTFHGAGDLMLSIKEDLVKVFSDKTKVKKDLTYYIYGELCGPRVQSGVYYGNEKRFIVFDIFKKSQWIKYDNLVHKVSLLNSKFQGEYKLELAPLMGRYDNLRDALGADNEFDSLLINKLDNTCEGVVIKSDVNTNRLCIKSKNSKFAEKSRRKKPIPQQEITEKLKDTVEDVLLRINENRFNNVLSKHEKFEQPTQIGFFIREFNKDILEPYVMPIDVSKQEWGLLTKLVNKEASNIVTTYFKTNIINNQR